MLTWQSHLKWSKGDHNLDVVIKNSKNNEIDLDVSTKEKDKKTWRENYIYIKILKNNIHQKKKKKMSSIFYALNTYILIKAS